MAAKKKPVAKKAASKKSKPKDERSLLRKIAEGALIAFGVTVELLSELAASRKPRRTLAGEEGRPKFNPQPRRTRERKPPAWWKILGVPQNASREEITRAYRDRMTGCHPDKVAHLSPQLKKVAEREAKKLNAAREAALQSCDRRD